MRVLWKKLNIEIFVAIVCHFQMNSSSKSTIKGHSTMTIRIPVDPSLCENKLLRDACEKGNAKLVKAMLCLPKHKGVNPAIHDNLPLRIACKYGHEEVVCLLLANAKVDPTARNHEAFRLACSQNHSFIIRTFLIDGRIDPSANNNEALRYAQFYKNRKTIDLLEADSRVQAVRMRIDEDPC